MLTERFEEREKKMEMVSLIPSTSLMPLWTPNRSRTKDCFLQTITWLERTSLKVSELHSFFCIKEDEGNAGGGGAAKQGGSETGQELRGNSGDITENMMDTVREDMGEGEGEGEGNLKIHA